MERRGAPLGMFKHWIEALVSFCAKVLNPNVWIAQHHNSA